MDLEKKKETARKRWSILAQVLKRGSYDDISDNSISVRRFQTFGLLSTRQIENGNDTNGMWFEYRCQQVPDLTMKIRHLHNSLSAERLNGFNNTGNVCVWPSEEVMTYYCMQHVQDFKGQRICELGGGMTCLAGVALGQLSDASHIEVTDGNEESVENLQEIIEANDFDNTSVSPRVLRWGEESPDSSLYGTFDTVICADCLFFDEGRQSLATLIHDLLKPGGKALIFAPSRGKTLYAFADIAQSNFDVTVAENYDSTIWNLHMQEKDRATEIYDENLHFPLMMTLTKGKTRDVTPESR